MLRKSVLVLAVAAFSACVILIGPRALEPLRPSLELTPQLWADGEPVTGEPVVIPLPWRAALGVVSSDVSEYYEGYANAVLDVIHPRFT